MEPLPRPPGWRAAMIGLTSAALLALSFLGDSWAFEHLGRAGVYTQGWGRMVWVAGYLPFWLLCGIGIYWSVTSAAGRRHALLLLAAPTLSGAVGQVLKLLIRRERPVAAAGAYVFRSFSDRPFVSTGFGMPSGDVIVAFAACAILARIWPRGRVVWYGLAAGCALARVMSRAHFLSDVVAAGVVGWIVADLLWRRFAPSEAPIPAREPI